MGKNGQKREEMGRNGRKNGENGPFFGVFGQFLEANSHTDERGLLRRRCAAETGAEQERFLGAAAPWRRRGG
jgi:hypothetical protein